MRAKRTRDSRRPAGQNDDDLPFEIEAGEIVVVQIRNSKPVPCEHQWSLDGVGRIDLEAHDGVFAQRELLGSAVAHELEARFCFDDLPAAEFDGLKVTIDTSRR